MDVLNIKILVQEIKNCTTKNDLLDISKKYKISFMQQIRTFNTNFTMFTFMTHKYLLLVKVNNASVEFNVENILVYEYNMTLCKCLCYDKKQENAV